MRLEMLVGMQIEILNPGEIFSELVKIENLKFLGISRYKFEMRFWLNLNSSVSRGTNSNPDIGLIWICSWLKFPHHSGFRFAFRRAFRVSSSREWAVRYHTRLAVCTCCTSFAESMMMMSQQFPRIQYVSPYSLGLVFSVGGRPLFLSTKSYMS